MNFLTATLLPIIGAIFGLGFLMVVHEGGHFLVARHFGMRVTTFSIGFGPAIWKRKPKDSPTTYQVAIIPFLAYVQIAGMNPLEDIDPTDKGSYANAPLHARILTIFAGPLANYLVASVLFFASFMIGGRPGEMTTNVRVMPDGPAAASGMKDGDKIIAVAGEDIKDWEQVRKLISSRPGQQVDIVVERAGQRTDLKLTPKAEKDGQGRIGVTSMVTNVPVPVGTAAVLALEHPPRIVIGLVTGLARIIRGQEKAELSGPVGITKEIAGALKRGFHEYVYILGALSAYLAGFNLLPIPALDGGRLMFLGYELTTRKRPNAKVEAHVHAIGLIMLLALVLVVTVFSDISRPGP